MEKSPEKLKTPESLAIACLHVYRFVATPLKLSFGLQGCCRHRPTCSHYMQEAIAVHGLGKGLGLGTRRVLRCHPWGTSGDDPVPPGNKPATPCILRFTFVPHRSFFVTFSYGPYCLDSRHCHLRHRLGFGTLLR